MIKYVLFCHPAGVALPMFKELELRHSRILDERRPALSHFNLNSHFRRLGAAYV